MESHRLSEAHLAVASAATTGDAGTLYRVVSRLMDDGVPFEAILFDLLLEVEREIGHRWQQGDYLVSEEHAATAAVETVISLLAGSFEQPTDAQTVVVGAVEGDRHSLPARAVAAHLLYTGFRTTFLGADVLTSDLERYLEEESPDALVLSAAMAIHLPRVREAIAASHRVGVPVVVGGGAFGEEGRWAAVLGADAWARRPADVARVLSEWEPDTAASEASAVEASEDATRVRRSRAQTLARVLSTLSAQPRAMDENRLATEVDLVLGALEASLLLRTGQPLVEMFSWQRETMPVQGLGEARALSGAVEDALGDVAPAAAAEVRSAARQAGI